MLLHGHSHDKRRRAGSAAPSWLVRIGSVALAVWWCALGRTGPSPVGFTHGGARSARIGQLHDERINADVVSRSAAAPLERRQLLTAGAVGLGFASQAAEALNGGCYEDACVDAFDALNIFARLAGPSCFGATAAKGLSCQAVFADFDAKLFQRASSVSEDEFLQVLGVVPPLWPLKPFGGSQKATAAAEKVAEVPLLTVQAMKRGIQKGAPKKMAASLQAKMINEPLPEKPTRFIFKQLVKISGSPAGELRRDQVAKWLKLVPNQALDYVSWLKLIGMGNLVWRDQL